MKTYFITGGCGFIGSNFIHYLIEIKVAGQIINLDKLTYAGNKDNLSTIEGNDYYHFIEGDICNRNTVNEILMKYNPDVIIHFAAESHVDRSIDAPTKFIQTNVVGTLNLLNESNEWLKNLDGIKKDSFRFIHISTDEVYGSLGETGKFLETTSYDPSSPYSASKASSDHLARSWYKTYDFPVLITNCSNNYGPFQFPEKLICDTDLLVMIVWSEVKYGRCDQWIYDTFEKCLKQEAFTRHYYLCDSEIPWQADDLRENPDNRNELFKLYLQKLREYGLDYNVVKGGRQERVEQVLNSLPS